VDVVEEDVPKAERNPKPAPLTAEEKTQLKAVDKPMRKRLEEQRREVVRRRGVLERNGYVITRLHHRYDASGLPEDIEVRPAANVEGGIALPTGPNAEMAGNVTPANESRLQIRYAATHPSKKVVQCENPNRYRWGKAPPDYRGLRKTWTARDIAYKKRDKFVLTEVVKSSVPALGIAATTGEPAAPGAAEAKAADAKADSGCSLSAREQRPRGLPAGWSLLALAVLPLRRALRLGRFSRRAGE
jgi:hypothetical protein